MIPGCSEWYAWPNRTVCNSGSQARKALHERPKAKSGNAAAQRYPPDIEGDKCPTNDYTEGIFGNEAPIPGSTASQLGFGRFPDLSSSQSAFPFASEQWQKMWMGHAKTHSSGHCSGLEPDSLFTTGREATHRHQIRDKSNGIFRLSVSKPAKTWSEDPAPLFAAEAIKPSGGAVCLACLPASGLWQTRGDEPPCGRCRNGAP